jgi:hypothetical protein
LNCKLKWLAVSATLSSCTMPSTLAGMIHRNTKYVSHRRGVYAAPGLLITKLMLCLIALNRQSGSCAPVFLQAGQNAAFPRDIQPVPWLQRVVLVVDLTAAQGGTRVTRSSAQEHAGVPAEQQQPSALFLLYTKQNDLHSVLTHCYEAAHMPSLLSATLRPLIGWRCKRRMSWPV